ncbi:MAG: hypothetical protein H5T69_18445, partial [Chloroflexi bacterium]|nr:hypothetical protein [Chloroflexota bacterium]
MPPLPLRAKVYIFLAVLTAVILSIWSLPVWSDGDQRTLLSILVFSLGIFVADLYPIRLVSDANAEVTVSCALKTALAIAVSPPAAIIATLLGTLGAELALRRAWYKAVFNTAEMVITVTAMSFIYEILYDGIERQPFHSVQNTMAVLGMVLTYLLVNTGLVTGIVSLASGASFPHVWKVNFLDSLWNNLTIIPLGAVLADLFMYRPWSILFLILPIVVVRRSFHYIAEFRSQTQEALVHMADAIDQRDPSTYQHSQRVAEYAQAIAEEMDLP